MLDDIWAAGQTQAKRKRIGCRPPTTAEAVQVRAKLREQEGRYLLHTQAEQMEAQRAQQGRLPLNPRGRPQERKPKTNIAIAIEHETQTEWARVSRGRQEAAWKGQWKASPLKLYDKLTKPEATALFLLRSEVIGLQAWLAMVKVPGVTALCVCKADAQTVRHHMLYWPKYNRDRLLSETGTLYLEEMLSQVRCTRPTAQWLIRSGALPQFQTTHQAMDEDKALWHPLQWLE